MTRARLFALPVLAALAALLPAAASAAPSAIDLSTYVPAGRFNLPTSADVSDQLAQEASAVTYDWDTDTLFLVGDEGTSVVQVSKTGALIDSMKLTGFEDTEGLTYVGGGKFAVTEERLRKVDRFAYAAGTTLARDGGSVDQVKLGTTVGNIGLEGVTNDPQTGGLVVVKEKDPRGIFATVPNWGAGTASVGSPATDNPPNLFDPDALGLADLSDVYALSNVAGLAGQPDAGHLIVISQESGKIVNVDRSGTVSSTLTIRRPAGAALTVPDMTMEGVTVGADGTVYVVNEQGGGVGVPQLWVYQHTDTPNAGPTAVTVSPVLTSIPENANTSAPTKVADVSVTDDDLGVNTLGLTGPDASSFTVNDTGLYLKAGVALSHASKPSYQVSVTVDDPSTGAAPDATSSAYTLTVMAASGGGPTTSAIRVTEVAPWGSSNGVYNADWFELTNTGTTTVDLTGWRMDDDSGAFGNAVVLNGVASLAPGESAIFLEGDSDTRTEWVTAWFPGGSAPQVGYYEGSGVGLSSGGDQVNVFDSLGNRITGVAFGAVTTGTTFDNAAGLDTITRTSAAGTAGAFTTGSGETGSPGTAPVVQVTEVAPWGSGNGTYNADWFELTNTASYAVDLTGWKMDDNSNNLAVAVALAGVTALAPGESAVFVQGDATKVAAFKSAWFGAAVPAGLQVGTFIDSGTGLGNGGDAVNIWDGRGVKQFGVTFGAATAKVSFDNAAGDATVTALSSVGTNGAFKSADTFETGSPGRIAVPAPPSVKVTEVDPSSSSASASTYAADWFELTNTGSTTVDLTGWKMDDSSNAFASAVALSGVTALAPGASAIFLEGNDTKIGQFKAAWAAANVPADLRVGSYSGSGVGLSTDGDGVNLFNAQGDRITGVSFGAATSKVTFDNRAGDATVSTLSANGVSGAVTSADGEIGSPGTIAALAQAKVTEVAPWGSGNGTYAADWFEVTNRGSAPLDLTGWKMDDSSNAYASAVALNGVATLAPGESAIFLEGTLATPAAFTSVWWGDDVPYGVQVGYYGGASVGLSTGGDGVTLFDAQGRRVDVVSFLSGGPNKVTYDNSAGAASLSTPSAVGTNGAFTSLTGGEVGSPGLTVTLPATPSVAVTEVSPWSSGDSSYAADWFELTNTGGSEVDLAGWKMDDSSNKFANAVALKGVSSLAPGASAIFVEADDDASGSGTVDDFVESWFGDHPPAGLKVGYYSGAGVGLGTGGDAVNVFNASARRVTGVAFGSATSGRTFDNAAGAGANTLPLPVVTTLSSVGQHGAFRSGEDEVGSPGTIVPDTTPPVVTYSGNLGTYTTGMAVHITCTAADERFGSGVVSTSCATIDGLGATFGVGPQAFTATATDAAGNVGTATVRFTVTPMPAAGTDTPASPPAGSPPAAGSSPSSSPSAPAAADPGVDAPESVKARQLAKGIATTLEHLAPTSTIKVEIRVGGRRLKTLRATANGDGDGTVRLKLSKRQLARVHGRTITVRYTVVGADGRERTLTQRIAVG